MGVLRRRPTAPIDMALYCIIAELADRAGRVRYTLARPITVRLLAVLLSRDGGHGVPRSEPSRWVVMNALERLEGYPDQPGYPRLIWVHVERRGRKAVGLNFQLATGRGQLRKIAPDSPTGSPTRKPAKPAMARVSGNYPRPGSPTGSHYSVSGSSIEEARAREAVDNPTDGPVEPARARELLRKARASARRAK